MKNRFLALVVMLSGALSVFGQSSSTPNVGFQIPATGSNNWYIPLNYNFNLLDQLLSGNATIPGLSIAGDLTVTGTLNAANISTGSGSSFVQSTGSTLNYLTYFNGTQTIAGVGIAGLPWYSLSAVPRAMTAADLNAFFVANVTGCGTTGNAYNPATANCAPSSGGGGGGGAQPITNVWSATFANTGGNTGSANGFNNIITNAAWIAQPSSTIVAEPSYTNWDNSAWGVYAGQGGANYLRGLMDLRNGGFGFEAVNPGVGLNSGQQYQGFSLICNMSTNPALPYGAGGPYNNGNNCYSLSTNSDIPGFYQGFMGGAQNPENATLQNFNARFYTAAINHSLDGGTIDVSGAGDTQIHGWTFTNHYGGGDHSADEGWHILRETVYPNGYGDFFGTIGAVTPHSSAGYTNIWLSSTAGAAGTMQTLFDTTQAITDTINGIGAGDGSGDVTLTMGKSTYPVSTAVTLGQNVNAIVNSQYGKTLQAITFNTTTDLSVSNPVTSTGPGIGFVGNGTSECAAVKSYGAYNSSAHTQVLNIMLSDAHNNGEHAYIGGMACHGFTIDADNTNVKSLFYVFGSSANNQLLAGRLTGASADGAFISGGAVHVYPTARITDVRPVAPYTGDDNWLNVEETGNTWNVSDNVETGLIATQQNDTYNWQIYDNGPYSSGSTFDVFVAGSQAGSRAARDIWRVQNGEVESNYTTGGGTYSNAGYLMHVIGPMGNGFKFENPIHGAFLTEFNCDWNVINLNAIGPIAGAGAGFAQLCANHGGTLGNALGWDFEGDTYFTSAANGDLTNPIVIMKQGGMDVHKPSTFDALATFNGGLTVASGTLTANTAFSFTDGGTIGAGNVLMTGNSGNQLNYTSLFGGAGCAAGFDTNGNLGCNTGAISASNFVAGSYVLDDGTSTGHTVTNISNGFNVFGIDASTNWGMTGWMNFTARGGIINLNTNGLTGSGQGVFILDGNLYGGYHNSGLSPGLTITSDQNTYGGGTNYGSLTLRVGDFTGFTYQNVLQATDVTTSGGIAALHLAPNGGLTTFGSYFQFATTTVSSLTACNSGTKNETATVSDATSPTYLGTLTGGGSVLTPVICNGTAWVSY